MGECPLDGRSHLPSQLDPLAVDPDRAGDSSEVRISDIGAEGDVAGDRHVDARLRNGSARNTER